MPGRMGNRAPTEGISGGLGRPGCAQGLSGS